MCLRKFAILLAGFPRTDAEARAVLKGLVGTLVARQLRFRGSQREFSVGSLFCVGKLLVVNVMSVTRTQRTIGRRLSLRRSKGVGLACQTGNGDNEGR